MHRAVIFLLIFSIPSVFLVDRHNFKTCQESSFCRRQRKYRPDVSPYQVDFKSMIKDDNGHLQFKMINTLVDNVQFQLDIFTLDHRTLRVKINEINSLRKRYEVKDSLVTEPKLVPVQLKKANDEQLEGHFGDNARFVLYAKPFRLDLFVNELCVMTVNSKNLFHFEHYRPKPG